MASILTDKPLGNCDVQHTLLGTMWEGVAGEPGSDTFVSFPTEFISLYVRIHKEPMTGWSVLNTHSLRVTTALEDGGSDGQHHQDMAWPGISPGYRTCWSLVVFLGNHQGINANLKFNVYPLSRRRDPDSTSGCGLSYPTQMSHVLLKFDLKQNSTSLILESSTISVNSNTFHCGAQAKILDSSTFNSSATPLLSLQDTASVQPFLSGSQCFPTTHHHLLV